MSSRSSRPSPRGAAERPLRSPTARGRAVPQSRGRRWLWPSISLGLVVVLVVGLLIVQTALGPNLDAVVTLSGPNIERGHKPGNLTYATTPPVGGVHNDTVQNCGIYDKPVANENAVHSLEHGTVWITYRPDLPADQVEQLRSLVRGHSHALLSPYPNLPAPIVASAWGIQLKIEGASRTGIGRAVDGLFGRSGYGTASDPRLRLFLSKYEQGTQTPEPGATCRGGVGTPIEQ